MRSELLLRVMVRDEGAPFFAVFGRDSPVQIEDSQDFVEARSAVARYEMEWWIHDTEVNDLCRRIPDLRRQLVGASMRSGLVTTADVYALAEEDPTWPKDWREVRLPVHNRVLLQRRSGRALLGKRPPASHAFITLGLPGSGKTSVLRTRVWEYYKTTISAQDRRRDSGGFPAGSAVLDADEIRQHLGEYQEGLGSGVVQPETSSLAYGPVKDRTWNTDFSAVVYDTVGHPEWLLREVEVLIAAGFQVSILLSAVPVETAVERAIVRFLETGRYVPPPYIRGRAGYPEKALDAVLASDLDLAGWGVWNTDSSVPIQISGEGIFAI